MRAREVSDLQAFVNVADALSFSRASEHMGVSVSALSQTIRRLETRVGARLLNRNTRSVALTDHGRELHGRLRQGFSLLDDAIDTVRAAGNEPRGIVRINTSRIASDLFICPMLKAFVAHFPSIEVELRFNDALENLVESGCDVGLRLGERLDRDMTAVKLGDDERSVVVGSANYFSRFEMPRSPTDLSQHQCIRFRWPGSKALYNWEFVEGERSYEVQVGGSLILNDADATMRAAVDGLGLAYLLHGHAAPALRSGLLVPVLGNFCPSFAGFYLYYYGRRHLPAHVRAFIDAVKAAASQPK